MLQSCGETLEVDVEGTSQRVHGRSHTALDWKSSVCQSLGCTITNAVFCLIHCSHSTLQALLMLLLHDQQKFSNFCSGQVVQGMYIINAQQHMITGCRSPS